MELQMILDTLVRIEAKLDKQEERVRKVENDMTRVYTVGGLISAAAGFIGWKV